MSVRRSIRRPAAAVFAAVAVIATLCGSVAVLMAADDHGVTPTAPSPASDWTMLNDRVTKLERLANTPPLPPDPTIAAHAAATQPDSAAHLDAPEDVKAAFMQMDSRVDAVERRMTLLEQKNRNPLAADDRSDQIRQLTQLIEDQRRVAKDLEDRVHQLEQYNRH